MEAAKLTTPQPIFFGDSHLWPAEAHNIYEWDRIALSHSINKERKFMTNPFDARAQKGLLAAMSVNFMAATSRPIAALAKQDRKLIRLLKSLDAISAISTFGGLLTRPEFHSNCYRLETLVHLATFLAQGSKRVNREATSEAFVALEPIMGFMEDPAEDFFVSLIPTVHGNFRVFEGIFEGAAFHLRQFMEMIDTMPDAPPFAGMRDSIFALLTLSEAVAERRGVPPHSHGGLIPLKHLSARELGSLSADRKTVTFSDQELSALGLDRRRLRPFIFDRANLGDIGTASLGHTPLERRPVIPTREGVILALPTAVTAAIRRFLIEQCTALGQEKTLFDMLMWVHARWLHEMPVLGDLRRVPLFFVEAEGLPLATAMVEIDAGRWLQLLAFADNFRGYADHGLVGVNPDSERLGSKLSAEMSKAAEFAASQPGYQAGMTLIVGCGWGRGLTIAGLQGPDGWRSEVISAHDLETLSSLPGYRSTMLWRTFDMLEKIRDLGVRIQNINGLLNLVAWQRGLDEHLVPHPQLPDGFLSSSGQAFLMIDQTSLRQARVEAALAIDRRRLRDVRSHWISVIRNEQAYFPEDRAKPFYIADGEVRDDRIKGAFITAKRPWWVSVNGEGSLSLLSIHWEMMRHWIGETAPVIEACISGLPPGPIEWDLYFDGLDDQRSAVPPPFDWNHVSRHFTIDIQPRCATVRMRVDGDFQAAFHHPENLAERAIVAALIDATGRLAEKEMSQEELSAAVTAVFPNLQARHLHMFEAREFRDCIAPALPDKFVKIAQSDGALLSLGLGWTVRAPGESPDLRGKSECTAFLNATVTQLEEDLCALLRRHGRRHLVNTLALTYETATKDKRRWALTASAVLALRHDLEGALQVMAEHEAETNGVITACRILLEAALCECPEQGVQTIGEIDLSRLMVLANRIFGLGGWSDAIHWDAMEPQLKISPLGDILANPAFDDQVVARFGRASNDVMVGYAVSRYSENYEPESYIQNVETRLDTRLVAAWRNEMGCSIDQMRTAIDALESEGVLRQAAVFEMKRSALLAVLAGAGIGPDDALGFVDGFTMRPRPSWRQAPAGYRARDREAWRFRRRLSVLRLPILQLEEADDPTLLIIPGMVRDAFIYTLRGFHFGDFDKSFAATDAMQRWIGTAASEHGHAFNQAVADRMGELGWEVRPDIKVTELLNKGFARDYGDVDVLAWNKSTGRVLLLECKDLQFRKTHGEIAEQLSDFRGEFDRRGKPDLLRKHLDRFDLVLQHQNEVRRFTKLSADPQIECHIVFRHPVPMQFLWDKMAQKAHLTLFDNLTTI